MENNWNVKISGLMLGVILLAAVVIFLADPAGWWLLAGAMVFGAAVPWFMGLTDLLRKSPSSMPADYFVAFLGMVAAVYAAVKIHAYFGEQHLLAFLALWAGAINFARGQGRLSSSDRPGFVVNLLVFAGCLWMLAMIVWAYLLIDLLGHPYVFWAVVAIEAASVCTLILFGSDIGRWLTRFYWLVYQASAFVLVTLSHLITTIS